MISTMLSPVKFCFHFRSTINLLDFSSVSAELLCRYSKVLNSDTYLFDVLNS
jgi:hypothetical protein